VTKLKRVILKLSGEAFGKSHEAVHTIAATVNTLRSSDIQVGIVVGGGNIFRGYQAQNFGFERAAADSVGMLATVINGLVLAQALNSLGCSCLVMSSFAIPGITERYHWQSAKRYLEQGEFIVFVGGTGNPFFTTDTTGALRASELDADLLLKATKVDGIYSKDPETYADAKKFGALTYEEALNRDLKVMDGAAIALCRDNHIPIYVFNIFAEDGLKKAVFEQSGGTLVTGEKK